MSTRSTPSKAASILAAVLLAEICQDVGLPGGVFNVLLGDAKAGQALVEHPDVRKVAFTDRQMVDNITDKVVKRLVQVTSAMKQDGENRVGLIKSETAYKVSQAMAAKFA